MNLVDDPWLPVVFLDGHARLVSLLTCLTNPDIQDLAVRPHERVAVMRLLLCILYAAVGIPTQEAWGRVPQRLPEAVKLYLEKYKGSFELFDPETPFLQATNVKKVAGSSGGTAKTSKLDFALASGNNTTLFDHEGQNEERVLTPAEMALGLLTYQNFSLAGIIGAVVWGKQQTGTSSSDAPCSPSSMLHSFLRGGTLLETLHLNMVPLEFLRRHFKEMPEPWEGRPIWEHFPQSPDDKEAVRNATQTFLGRLVPFSRVILLNQNGKEMLLGNGLAYPSFSNPKNAFPAEVTATVVLRGEKGKETPVLLGLQPGKSIWRELHSLAVKYTTEKKGHGCLALRRVHRHTEFDFLIVGLARDKAEVVDTLESVYHVSSKLLNKFGRKIYESSVRNAELAARTLGSAIKVYRENVDGGFEARLKLAGPGKGGELGRLQSKAMLLYWTALEKQLPRLFRMISLLDEDSFGDEREQWCKLVWDTALDVYTTTCGKDNARQALAFTRGKGVLLCRAAADRSEKEVQA